MNTIEQRKYLQKDIELLSANQIALVAKYVKYLQSSSSHITTSQPSRMQDPLQSLVHTIKQTRFNPDNIIPATRIYKPESTNISDNNFIAPSDWDATWDQLEKELKEESLSHENNEREQDW